jgi:hypothetical protein
MAKAKANTLTRNLPIVGTVTRERSTCRHERISHNILGSGEDFYNLESAKRICNATSMVKDLWISSSVLHPKCIILSNISTTRGPQCCNVAQSPYEEHKFYWLANPDTRVDLSSTPHISAPPIDLWSSLQLFWVLNRNPKPTKHGVLSSYSLICEYPPVILLLLYQARYFFS